MSAWTCRQLSERSPKRSFHLVFESHDGTAYVPIPERSTSLRVTSTPPVVDSQKRLTPNGRLEKRTLELSREMSALCQKETYAPHQNLSLFDNLVRLRGKIWWHFDAERLGGFEVDDELKFGRLHHRQV